MTTEEVKRRYRARRKAQGKVRWRALHLISTGLVAAEAARRVGRSSSWITMLVARYNRAGAPAVKRQSGERRHGPRPRVDAAPAKRLGQALRSSAPDGGLWTGPKVAARIAERTGQRVHPTTAWRAPRRLGFSLQTPRPQNRRRASAEGQAEFKKS